ncbi:hypothetical protein BpHYR1_028891 [Brachionus plicatilis]|uniref:Uncharacterized protein n=1 Tax=Brachionus plicatilis TaxID=10195 RepID=A0A3M7RZB2_BRAPC|nr:hypothetical protein BpHYR1_028891 [Brachionus plicatilis]
MAKFVQIIFPNQKILAQCTNESDSDEEFDYIKILEKIREEKRREKASLESNTSKRLVELTQDAINNEIYNYWKSNNFKQRLSIDWRLPIANSFLKLRLRFTNLFRMSVRILVIDQLIAYCVIIDLVISLFHKTSIIKMIALL